MGKKADKHSVEARIASATAEANLENDPILMGIRYFIDLISMHVENERSLEKLEGQIEYLSQVLDWMVPGTADFFGVQRLLERAHRERRTAENRWKNVNVFLCAVQQIASRSTDAPEPKTLGMISGNDASHLCEAWPFVRAIVRLQDAQPTESEAIEEILVEAGVATLLSGMGEKGKELLYEILKLLKLDEDARNELWDKLITAPGGRPFKSTSTKYRPSGSVKNIQNWVLKVARYRASDNRVLEQLNRGVRQTAEQVNPGLAREFVENAMRYPEEALRLEQDPSLRSGFAGQMGLSARTLHRYRAEGVDISDPIAVSQEKQKRRRKKTGKVEGMSSARDLAKAFGISDSTVREAVKRLRKTGWSGQVNGQGHPVFSPKDARCVFEQFSEKTRKQIESRIAAIEARGRAERKEIEEDRASALAFHKMPGK